LEATFGLFGGGLGSIWSEEVYLEVPNCPNWRTDWGVWPGLALLSGVWVDSEAYTGRFGGTFEVYSEGKKSIWRVLLAYSVEPFGQNGGDGWGHLVGVVCYAWGVVYTWANRGIFGGAYWPIWRAFFVKKLIRRWYWTSCVRMASKSTRIFSRK